MISLQSLQPLSPHICDSPEFSYPSWFSEEVIINGAKLHCYIYAQTVSHLSATTNTRVVASHCFFVPTPHKVRTILNRILVANPEERATLADLLEDPWMVKGNVNISPHPHPPPPLHTQLHTQMHTYTHPLRPCRCRTCTRAGKYKLARTRVYNAHEHKRKRAYAHAQRTNQGPTRRQRRQSQSRLIPTKHRSMPRSKKVVVGGASHGTHARTHARTNHH